MKPRSIFRARRRRGGPTLGRLAALGAKLTPGTVTVLELWHDPDCRRPQGGPCTCADGPDSRLRPLDDPARN